MVQVYVKKEMDKSGKWLSSRVILNYDRKSGSVTITSGNEKSIAAAVGDVRPAVFDDSFANFKIINRS